MVGYTRAEALALRISDVHPAEMREFIAFARTVLETESGWTNELACLTRSGTTLPAEISASVIEMDGRARVIAMVRDISERKHAEAELQRYRESRERLVAELPRVGSHLQAVLDERRAVLCRDLAVDRRTPFEDALLREGLRAYIAVPLVTKGKTLGTLNVGSEAPDRSMRTSTALSSPARSAPAPSGGAAVLGTPGTSPL
jgi:GAF domain-containing protein